MSGTTPTGGGSGHESPAVMVIPLAVLAGLSALGGFLGIPHWSWLEHWLEPVIPSHEGLSLSVPASMEWILMFVSVAGAAAGIAFAIYLYSDLQKVKDLAARFAAIQHILRNKWYIDEIYQAIFVKPIRMLSDALWKGFDVAVIDRIVLGFGRASQWTGSTVRVIQTGSIQTYALVILFGLVATAGYLIYARV